MGSNTHEGLVMARFEIEAALIEEREGSGASESIIRHIVRAHQELARAMEVQRAILGHREQIDVVFPEPSEAANSQSVPE